MKLVPVSRSPTFYATCQKCGIRSLVDREPNRDWHADLTGEPWQSYYCPTCSDLLKKGAPCSNDPSRPG